MATTGYKRILLIGGTSDALDSISGATLVEDDFAFVLMGGAVYLYNYKDYGSPEGENVPYVIVPDTAPGNFAWQLQEQPASTIISSDTTIYLTTAGDDVTGAGTSGDPWYSLEKAFNSLKDKWINTDVTVTISVGDGTYTGLSTVYVKHPCANKIHINGVSKTTTILTFTGDGIDIIGTNLYSIQDLCLKGASASSSEGLRVKNGGVINTYNVKFDTWGYCVWVSRKSHISFETCTFYNFTYGVYLRHSSAQVATSTFDGNSVSNSYGCYSSYNSSLWMVSSTTFANLTYGCYTYANSFIAATQVTSNTATTPYTPLATTSIDAEPTWGKWGSWIKD